MGSSTATTPKRRRRAREAGVPYLHTGPLPVRRRLAFLIETLGNNVVADLIGVSPSQPSRWRAGKVRMNPDNEKLVVDLDYVVARLLRVYKPAVVGLWLTAANPALGGGRPIDVLRRRGADGLGVAIGLEEQQGYL